MRFTENRSDEIRAMVTVVGIDKPKPRKFTEEQLDSLLWFYDQVADLVERQEEEDLLVERITNEETGRSYVVHLRRVNTE